MPEFYHDRMLMEPIVAHQFKITIKKCATNKLNSLF